MNDYDNRNSFLWSIALTVVLLIPGVSPAEQAPEPDTIKTGLGVGVAIARFDVNVKFTDKQSGSSRFIDASGTLGLPEVGTIPIIYGTYRFSPKHAMQFSYFQVKRQSTFLAVDEDIGDIEITGDAQISDETKIFNLGYAYTLFEDDRSRIHGLLGVNGMDVKYALEAEGTITSVDESTTGTLREEASVSVPLPLVGLDFWYAFTPKWSISTKASFVAGQSGDVTAWVVNTNINSLYRFNKYVGGVLGIAYFDADVDIDESTKRTEINYGYDGLFLGLHVTF